MSNAAVAQYRIYELPWSTGFEDDARFKKLARGSLVSALVLALLFWVLPEPQVDPAAEPAGDIAGRGCPEQVGAENRQDDAQRRPRLRRNLIVSGAPVNSHASRKPLCK